MGCGAAEATGLGFLCFCFFVLNYRVLLAIRVDFCAFLFHNFSKFFLGDRAVLGLFKGWLGLVFVFCVFVIWLLSSFGVGCSCLLLLVFLFLFVWSFRFFDSWFVPLRQYSSSTCPSFHSPPHQIKSIRRLVMAGVAVHHGGLLPLVKEMVEVLFGRSLVKVGWWLRCESGGDELFWRVLDRRFFISSQVLILFSLFTLPFSTFSPPPPPTHTHSQVLLYIGLHAIIWKVNCRIWSGPYWNPIPDT